MVKSGINFGETFSANPTVENAVWAVGEIGTSDVNILEDIAQLLDKPGQTYRVIIHTLTKLNYEPALDLGLWIKNNC